MTTKMSTEAKLPTTAQASQWHGLDDDHPNEHRLNWKPALFGAKKCFLTMAILTTILLLVLIIVNSNTIARETLKRYNVHFHHHQKWIWLEQNSSDHLPSSSNSSSPTVTALKKDVDEANLTTLIVYCSVALIMLNLIFLYGILRQSLYLTAMYSAVSSIGSVLTIAWAIQKSVPWSRIIWPTFTTLVAICYLIDLIRLVLSERRVKRSQLQQQKSKGGKGALAKV